MKFKFESQATMPESGFGVGMIFFVRKTGKPERAGINVFIEDVEQYLTVTEAKAFHKGLRTIIKQAENMNRMGH